MQRRGVLHEAAGADAHERDPVAVVRIHVGLDLEHEAREGTRHGIDRPRVGFARARRRRHLEEALEERLDTEIGQRAAEEGRRLRARAHGREIELRARAVEQRQRFGELAREDAGLRAHRVGVRGSRDLVLLDARRPVASAREDQQLAADAVVDAAELAAGAERPVHGDRVDAEHLLDLVQQIERLAPQAIQLVDEGEDRDAAQAADLEQLARLRLHALAGVDQHHGAVGGHQRAVGVLAEVLVAGRVEDVDAVARVLEVHHRGADRDAALLLELEPVAGRMPRRPPRAHRAGFAQRAAEEQQLLGERGLARVRMRDDREGPAPLDLAREAGLLGVLRHDGSSGGVPARRSFSRARSSAPPRRHMKQESGIPPMPIADCAAERSDGPALGERRHALIQAWREVEQQVEQRARVRDRRRSGAPARRPRRSRASGRRAARAPRRGRASAPPRDRRACGGARSPRSARASCRRHRDERERADLELARRVFRSAARAPARARRADP